MWWSPQANSIDTRHLPEPTTLDAALCNIVQSCHIPGRRPEWIIRLASILLTKNDRMRKDSRVDDLDLETDFDKQIVDLLHRHGYPKIAMLT